jgi:hypothetical protein
MNGGVMGLGLGQFIQQLVAVSWRAPGLWMQRLQGGLTPSWENQRQERHMSDGWVGLIWF